ncbi:MAG: transmembrane 220 family protein [Bacteroidota bacterium]
MKIFNWFFVVCFVLFAAVQYNDPDFYTWIPLYLYVAFLCWQATKGKFVALLYWIGYIVYVPYAIYKVFDANGVIDWITKDHAQNIAETMKAETPWVEEAREFFGLVIIITVMVINHIYLTCKKKAVQ